MLLSLVIVYLLVTIAIGLWAARRVKNTTDKHLLAGPITVLEAGTYAGDARIDNVPPGQERLLSYGIDLQMLVDSTKNRTDSALQTGKIVKGVLWITRKHVSTQNYIADNKSDHDKTLIVENVVNRKTEYRIKLSSVDEPESPAFSPDGTKIAFSALKDGIGDIFTVELGSNKVTALHGEGGTHEAMAAGRQRCNASDLIAAIRRRKPRESHLG